MENSISTDRQQHSALCSACRAYVVWWEFSIDIKGKTSEHVDGGRLTSSLTLPGSCVGRTHIIVRFQTGNRRKDHGTENFVGFVCVG